MSIINNLLRILDKFWLHLLEQSVSRYVCSHVFIYTHTLAPFGLGNQNISARARADEDQDLDDDRFKCHLLSASSVSTNLDMTHYAVITILSSGQR